MKFYVQVVVILLLLAIGIIIYFKYRKKNMKSKQLTTLEKYHQTLLDKFTNTDNKQIVQEKLNYVPIYYINIEHHTCRNKYMINQGTFFNIQLNRIDGVYGKNKKIDIDTFEIYPGYNIQYINKYKTGSKSELGCTLSHIKAIFNAYYNGNNVALIVEDDVSFSLVPFWKTSIKDIIDDIPKDWEIITLYSHCSINKSHTYEKFTDDFSCVGAVAYLINKKGMKNIIERIISDNIIVLGKDYTGNNLVADSLIYNMANSTYHYLKYQLFYTYNIDSLNSTIHKNHTKYHVERSLTTIIPYLYYDNNWDQYSIITAKKLLYTFWNFSKQNNIQYTLAYGSLLGWVRHNKKPIPWDDDLDIITSVKNKKKIRTYFSNHPLIGIKYIHNIDKIYLKNAPIVIEKLDKVTWPFIDIFYHNGKEVIGFETTKIDDDFNSYIDTVFLETPCMIIKNYLSFIKKEYGHSCLSTCVSSNYNHKLEEPNKDVISIKCQQVLENDIEKNILRNIPDKKLKNTLFQIYNNNYKLVKNTNLKWNNTGRDHEKCQVSLSRERELSKVLRHYFDQSDQKIPKIIHQIWIGQDEPPMIWINTIKKFVEENPEWDYKLWRERDIEQLDLINSIEYHLEKTMHGKSDILRYEILFQFGGIYIDADTVWLGNKSINDLLKVKNGFFVAYELNNKHGLANGTIGSSKYNPITYSLIKNVSGIFDFYTDLQPFISLGPYLIDRSVKYIRDLFTIYPSFFFYPVHWDTNKKEKRTLRELKNIYKDSYFFQYGYTTNNYKITDFL